MRASRAPSHLPGIFASRQARVLTNPATKMVIWCSRACKSTDLARCEGVTVSFSRGIVGLNEELSALVPL